MLGSLISAGANLLGGLFNRDAAKDAAQEANAVAERNALRNIELQKQFAQEGIRWKVNDAREAGIHPLYALGASTTSFAPVSVGHTSSYDGSMGKAIANAGQDIGRAINAGSTAGERATRYTQTVEALNLERLGLENELLASKIRKENTALPPPFPGAIPEATKPEDRPLLQIGGSKIQTDPATSNQEEFEKRYGDDGPVSWATQAAIAWRDLQQNIGHMNFLDILRAVDRKTQLDIPTNWKGPFGGNPWR